MLGRARGPGAVRTRPSLVAIFAVAGLFGIARAFTMPASAALGPMLVPREVLPRAVGWNSLAMQTGMVLGPWLGGVLCAVSVPLSYSRPAAFYIWRRHAPSSSSAPTPSPTTPAARGCR